jgi:hypothetical protein
MIELNEAYTLHQIIANGMMEKEVKDLEARIFTKDNKVYFFENLNNHDFRLYTVINKKSFFL